MTEAWKRLLRVVLLSLSKSRQALPAPTRPRTAEQARKEAALLRKIAAGTMGALSVSTHAERVEKKRGLDEAVARLEAEAERLDAARDRRD